MILTTGTRYLNWVVTRGCDSFPAADGSGGGGGAQLGRLTGRRYSECGAAGGHRGRVPGSVHPVRGGADAVPVRAAMRLVLLQRLVGQWTAFEQRDELLHAVHVIL